MNNTKSNINYNNEWADHWHYKIGINIFPLDYDKKTYEEWSKYQNEPIPDELHEEWKRTNRYAQGIILMLGKVWRGENKGLYFVGIDFDKQLGFQEFCSIFRENTSIDELKEKFIIEQHEKDLNSFHVYFYSEIPFTDKSSDTTLGIEIKSNNKGLMCGTPSYHSETDSRWQIKGTDSPVLLKSEEALKLVSDINEICKKHNVLYIKNEKDVSSSSNKLPEPLRQLVNWLEIPPNFQFRIHEGSRHNTLISFANSLLFKYRFDNNVSKDELKNFFYGVNNKLCVPEPLPEDEIKTIWRDSLKHSEEKTSRIKIEGDDENDASSYKTQIRIPLDYDDQLLETVETFVYDIQKNSIDCSLNSKYKSGTRIIVPINIKQWPDVRKAFRNQCNEKGIDKQDTLSLLESLDKNIDKITKHYLESQRKNIAALAAAEERKRQKLHLIREGTEFVMAKYSFATIEETKEILFYDDTKGVYVYGGEIEIEKAIEKKYGYQLNTASINEIKDFVIRKTYIKKEKFDSDIDITNVKNGLLNMKTGELLSHTPDYYSLNQIPIKYNPEAKAPKFEKFLSEVLYPEQIRTAKEIIAYTFIRKNIFQYWFVLIGNGGNGKNVFVGIVSSLHGKKNVSSVPLTHLANPNHRFALSRLENKNINVDTELSVKSYNDLSTLKKLTDTQPITVEQKGKDLYDVELWAKLFLCCNELPISSDDSDARYRREIILSFPYQFEEEKKDDPNIKVADPFLLDKIVNDEDEMSGILNLVIDSSKSIYDNKKIYVNSTISQRRVRAELISNPVKAFYDENCIIPSDPAAYEKGEDLYNAFVKFCNIKESHILNYKQFIKKLKKEHDAEEGRARIQDQNGKEHRIRVLFKIHLLNDDEKKKKVDEEEEEEEE